MDSLIFKTKARIGKILTDSFFRKLGKKLAVSIHQFNGSVHVEWARIGSSDKPTLIFLHGFADRKENFYFTARHLLPEFRIIIPDMPGFGNSTIDKNLEYSLDNYEKWLSEFITHSGLSKYHLAGNSLGGAVAAKLAIRHPERTLSLTLADAAGFYIPGVKSVYDEALEGINLFQINSVDEFDRFHSRIFCNPPRLPAFVREYMVHKSITLRDWFGKIFNDLGRFSEVSDMGVSLEDLSLNNICSQIQAPVNIVWGKQDSLFPYQTAGFLCRELMDARMCILDNIGHCPHLEAPELFSKELVRFTGTLPESR